jgi:iron complex outermembrane receptor protein
MKVGLLFAIIITSTIIARAQYSTSAERDTIYYLSPVIIVPSQAYERETPVTFSNLNQKQITERHFSEDVPVLLAELPSITFYSENGNGVGYSYLNLRGFDQRRLSIMVNGIPQNDPEDHQVYWIDMPDMLAYTQNVQIQRGAGSSFYGPPAIGGSINFITSPFSEKPMISLGSGFGFQEFGGKDKIELNVRKYTAAFSSGLIDKRYTITGNFSKINSDGYREKSWVNMSSYFFSAARFDENMTTRIQFYGGPISDGLAYIGLPKYYNKDKILRLSNYSYWDATGYITNQKPQALEIFSQPHYEIHHVWKFSPTLTLSNSLFYINGGGYYDYDGDWLWYDNSALSWFHNIVGYDSSFGSTKFPSILLRGYVQNNQWGWLPHIDIEHENGKLTLGGELRFHRSTHWGKIPFASEYPSSTFDPDFHFYEYNGSKDIFSLYGHEIYHPDETTTVMAELQLAFNRYGIHNERFLGHNFDLNYLFINPRLGINRNFTEEINGYISLGYTSREPRLRNLYAAEDAWSGSTPKFEVLNSSSIAQYNFNKPIAQPEHLFDLELGGSYIFIGGKISANVYWMEFSNELVKSGEIDIFGSSVLVNAKRTRHVGLEFESNYKLTKELEVNGTMTLSFNHIIHHELYDAEASIYRVLDGNPIAGFPDILGNVRLSYVNDNRSISLLIRYVGPFCTDNLHNEQNKVDGYAIANLDASVKLPTFLTNTELQLTGKVQNLLNNLYIASGEGKAFFPAAERNYSLGITLNL